MADYQAGNAYLQVLPSTRGFAQRLKSELAGVKQDYTVNVGVDVDQRGLAGLQAALRALPVVVLDADSSQADREIAALRARIQELSGKTIGVDISGEQARREVSSIKADLDRLGASSPDVALRVDAGAASAALDRVNRDISQVDGRRVTANVNVDVNRALQSLATLALALNSVEGRSFNASVLVDTGRAVAGVAMLVTKLFAIGGAVGAISSVAAAILALGPVAAVAGGGIAALVLGFGGVGKALSALSAQQDAAGQSAGQQAKQQQSAGFAIANAQASVARAAQQAGRAREDGARSVAKAEQDSARSVTSAQGQVDSAQRSLAQASSAAGKARADAARSVQRAEAQAAESIASAMRAAESAHRQLASATRDLERNQRDLTSAWEEGRRSLEDLQDQVDSNRLDQRQAALDLRDAEKELAAARASGDTDQIERAQLAYDKQVETIDQLNKRTQRLGSDNATAQRAGVAGSEAVVAANERIAASQQAVRGATQAAGLADRDVSKARADGAASVADAQRSAAESIQSADERVASAQIALASAQDGLAQARMDGAARVAEAQRSSAQAIADADQGVIDAQRSLAQVMAQTADSSDSAADKVKQAFENLSPAAAAFAMYLWSLKPALDQLRATAASGLFPPLQAGLQVLMGQFSVFQTVIGQFASAVGNALGYVLTQLASPFWVSFFSTLGNVAGPLLMQLAQALMAVVGVMGNLILAMLPFAPMAIDMLTMVAMLIEAWTPFIAMFVGQLLPVFGMLLQALMPLGPVLAALAPILAVLGQAFSMVLGAVLTALAPILVALTPLIEQLAMAFAQQLVAAIQAATPFLVGLATFMSQHPGLVLGVISVLGGLFSAWTLLKTAVGALLGPLMLMRLATLALGISAATMGSMFGGAFAGVIGIVGRFIGQFSFMRLAGTLLGGIGGGIMGIGRAVLGALGPVGWIITALTIMYSSSEAFRGAINNLLGVLGGVLMSVLQALMPLFDALVGVFNLIMGVLGQLLSQIAQALVPVLNMFAGIIGELAMALLPPLMSVVQSLMPVFGLLGEVVGSLGQALAPMMDAWLAMSTALLPPLMGLLQSVVIPVFGFLARLLAGELTLAIKYVLIPAWTAIAWVLSNVVVPVVVWLAGVMAAAYRGIAAVLTWLWQAVFVPAWNAIAAVVTWAWVNILQPVISAIWTVLKFLGAILFTIIVAPFIIAWNLISAAVSWAWTNVLQPVWQAIVWFAQNVLGPVISWLYTNIVKPIWDAIGAAISFVWNSIILPIWNALVWVINNVLIPSMQFYYYNVILPIWNAIGAAISFVWNSIILPVWNALVWVINNVLIPATQFLYNNVIKPIWDAIGAAIMWVWTNVIQPAFNAVWGGLQWLGDRFRDGVGFIQRIWDTIRGILARPINFMINTVWNNGILTAWNKVAGLIGIPAIAPLAPIAEMATGGHVRGPGTGTSDDVPIWASNGEFMVREKIASQAGPFLAALNAGDGEALQAAGATRAGRSGMFHGTSAIGMDVRGYRNGGPIFASGHGVWGSAGRYAMGGPIEERINAAKAWLSGPARGIPYVWGGGSMSGMDCSGMQAAVTHILSGRPPTSGRIGTTASMPWGGFVPGINGQYAIGNKPSDHMAGTLGGQNVEQHGPSGTPFSFPSRWGADASYFTQQFHLGEAGGNFVSGGGGGGSWFNPLPGLVRAAFKLTDIPLNIFKSIVGDPPPDWKSVPVGLAFKIRDSLRDFAIQKAEMAGPSSSEDVSGITGPVVEQVRQVAARYGWDQGPEWDAIARIVQKESSWNPNAASPISSARGLFQKMTSLNGPVEPTPAGQAAWGLSYIQRRYGTPTAAWAWHQSHNWYDDGGMAYGRGLMLKNTDAPERVLPPQETQAYPTLTRLTQQLEAGRVPTASLTNAAAQARSASLGATDLGGFPGEVRLSGGQLRILGPDLVEIVDGRLELVADKLTDGRVGP
ncbi:hypothetical protein GCM10023201_40900 [Actinomycetospora corticicola]|uniref:Phage-related protein n=1 Tax=Actinomycetospora corticicola TaxID=663602 RepID=A0A7Y9DWR1_9PSEU|nr:hypothetical protein [Actinomycetospora corticicola]NYD36826.1 phage-related protein [Actinomycetospora corticicola]